MKSSYLTPFTKAMLTGLFAGIIATVICLAFNVAFREKTNYQPASLINVSSLIFFVNLVFLIIGIIYYGFIRYIKRGDVVFMIVFALLTAFLAWKADEIDFSANSLTNLEFHQLLMAMVIIMGVFAAIVIPILYRSKKFEEQVL